MPKTPTINVIFEKKSSGEPTKKSLLYQDILNYCRMYSDDGRQIIFYDLVAWLVKHNDEFSNYYKDAYLCHTPMKNRISSRWDRVYNCFDNLVVLGLVEKTGQKFGVKGNIMNTYRLGWYGRLISALSLCFRGVKENEVDRIYGLIIRNLENEPSALDKFSIVLLRKYKANGIFNLIVHSMLEAIASDLPIVTYSDLIYQSIPRIENEEMLEKIVEIRRQAYNELTEREKEIYLFRHKINIERSFFYSARAPANYEDGVYRFKGDPFTVVVEGHCKNCNNYWSVALRTHDFIDEVYSHQTIRLMCENCNKPSLNIPSHWSLLI